MFHAPMVAKKCDSCNVVKFKFEFTEEVNDIDGLSRYCKICYKKQKLHARSLAQSNVACSPCERCGSEKNINRHHRDYFKPLDVTLLCASCHSRLHAEIRRGYRWQISFSGFVDEFRHMGATLNKVLNGFAIKYNGEEIYYKDIHCHNLNPLMRGGILTEVRDLIGQAKRTQQ